MDEKRNYPRHEVGKETMENNLLEVIYQVLQRRSSPLTAEAILKDIQSFKLYEFTGKTPKTAIRARLAENIDKLQGSSEFVRLQKGTYGLRIWLEKNPDRYQEYQADKKKTQLMEEYLAVFDKNNLSQIIRENGLKETKINSDWFKQHCFAKVRFEAEKDFSVIQLISVFLVISGNKVITHTRSARAPESRLHGERSIIFGGHITYDEVNSLFDPFDPSSTFPLIERELEEEINITNNHIIKPIGLLYDSKREVSSQHLGIVYLVEMTDEEYEIGEKGYHINDELTSTEDVIKNKNDYENWSLELIEKVLEKRKS